MDTLIEQIYRHKNTAAENLKKYGILVVVLAAATAVMVMIRLLAGNAFAYMLGGIACLVIIYLGAKVYMRYKYIEYEYTYMNGEIDIDKIMSQAFRKRIITVNYKHFREYGDYDDGAKARLAQRQFDTVIDVSSNMGTLACYAVVQHPSEGITLLIFEPNDKIRADLEKRLATVLR